MHARGAHVDACARTGAAGAAAAAAMNMRRRCRLPAACTPGSARCSRPTRGGCAPAPRASPRRRGSSASATRGTASSWKYRAAPPPRRARMSGKECMGTSFARSVRRSRRRSCSACVRRALRTRGCAATSAGERRGPVRMRTPGCFPGAAERAATHTHVRMRAALSPPAALPHTAESASAPTGAGPTRRRWGRPPRA